MRITLGGIVHDEGVRTDTPWPPGRWLHFAVTLEGDTARLYVDGALVASDTATLNPRDLRATGLWLGRNVYQGGRYLKGRLDEVRLYNHALNEQELRQLIGADR